jgi:transcriptional regulator with XRE-family HTH domain
MASQFGVRLRRLRLRAGMTQEQVAERSGLGVRTIRRLESGEGAEPITDVDRPMTAFRHREPLASGLVEVSTELALVVRARLRRGEQQIPDLAPLPVRWRPAPARMIDSWSNISMARPGEIAQTATDRWARSVTERAFRPRGFTACESRSSA